MMGMSLQELFLGSPIMAVLVICLIVTVGYAVERSLYFRRSRSDVRGFMKQLTAKLQSGDHQGTVAWCAKQRSAAARVVNQCLPFRDIESGDLKQRFDTAVEMEQVEMERNLAVLGTMSSIAPLLGLFGSVIGIIRAFADIARTGAGGSSVVAMGVSVALLTTAAGIGIAVVATVCFNLFVRRIRTRIIELENVREDFFGLLRATASGRPAAAGPWADERDAGEIYEAVTTSIREPAGTGR